MASCPLMGQAGRYLPDYRALRQNAAHAVRAWRCPLREASIVAVLRLKVLNLVLALLSVHSAFLAESERLNKHSASESESLKDCVTTVTAAIECK